MDLRKRLCVDLSLPHQILKSPPPLKGRGAVPPCSQHLWETLNQQSKLSFFVKIDPYNKKLTEDLDLCFGKLNSCFDNLSYKKFAGKISMDLDIPS